MICPCCDKEISDSALRCRFCKNPVRDVVVLTPKDLWRKARKFLLKGRDTETCAWSILDVGLIGVIIYIFISRDPLGLGREIMGFLRLHFNIFTQEPKLFYYLNVYINTIILKAVLTFVMVILVKIRGLSFWKDVVFGGHIPRSWMKMLPYYAGACVIMRIASLSNPLTPNIPMNSIFPEARLIGNAVMIFSILFVAPFTEEVLFRGFVYPAFNKRIGMYPAIILTSVIFTMAHYPQIKGEALYIAAIFTFSAITTYARAKTGSTWLAMIMHHIYNLVYVAIGVISFMIVRY